MIKSWLLLRLFNHISRRCIIGITGVICDWLNKVKEDVREFTVFGDVRYNVAEETVANSDEKTVALTTDEQGLCRFSF